MLLAGACGGSLLFWGVSLWSGTGESPEMPEPENGNPESEITKDIAQMPEEIAVDYPFSYTEEGWTLILYIGEDGGGGDGIKSGCEFRMYDESGQLLQTFPCRIEAEEYTFKFDHLFSHEVQTDLEVFPANAEETGAKGLCYPWDSETGRFSEDPVEIPWYQVKDGYRFVTSERDGDTVTDTICRINEGSRQVVELRKWTLSGGPDWETYQSTTGMLCIRDCLEEQDLYNGEVEWNDVGRLVNDEYYQELFWSDLELLGAYEEEETLSAVWVKENSYTREEYADRESFLADCGFAGEEPFYQVYDRFRHLKLELFFDPIMGRGCGILYDYLFNYDLECVTMRQGFVFETVLLKSWEQESEADTFSRLSVVGTDVRNAAPDYQESYGYTEEGNLSFFEARGSMLVDREEVVERVLLSMHYIYRNDGTLYHKEYFHEQYLFGTSSQYISSDYDELGRIIYQYSYITHGAIEQFYIYGSREDRPDYCLSLDGDWPVMIHYE